MTNTLDDFITTKQGQALTGYSRVSIRYLARSKRVKGIKPARDWLIDRASLMAYVSDMKRLGTQKFSGAQKGGQRD